MQLDDERWAELKGGYGVSYDPRSAIDRIAAGDLSAWAELWQELHHQGDVGDASYAAIPELVRIHKSTGKADWNIYALSATIEEARHNCKNPVLPDWLSLEYDEAWRSLEAMALDQFAAAEGVDLIDSIIAVLALSKQRLTMARMAMLTEDERKEMLDTVGWG